MEQGRFKKYARGPEIPIFLYSSISNYQLNADLLYFLCAPSWQMAVLALLSKAQCLLYVCTTRSSIQNFYVLPPHKVNSHVLYRPQKKRGLNPYTVLSDSFL